MAAGQEDPSALRVAELTLSRMQQRLVSLDADYSAAKEEVSGVVTPRSKAASSSGSGGNKVQQQVGDSQAHFC